MTLAEQAHLRQNGIAPNSISERIYKEFRQNGLNHQNAINQTLNSIQNMTSTSFDNGTLNCIKNAFFNIPGIII